MASDFGCLSEDRLVLLPAFRTRCTNSEGTTLSAVQSVTLE